MSEEHILPMSINDGVLIEAICTERITELAYLPHVAVDDAELRAAHCIRRGVYETRRLIVIPPDEERRPMSDEEIKMLALWADYGRTVKVSDLHPFTGKYSPRRTVEARVSMSDYEDLTSRLLAMRVAILSREGP